MAEIGRLMPVGKGQIGLLSETLLYVAMQRTGQIIHQAGRRYIVGDLFHIGVQEALFLSITLIAFSDLNSRNLTSGIGHEP